MRKFGSGDSRRMRSNAPSRRRRLSQKFTGSRGICLAFCNTVVFAVTGDVEAKATATKRLREYRREKPTFPRLTRYVLVSEIPLLGDSGLVDSIVLDSIDDPKLVSQLVEKAKEISVRTPKIAKRILRNILNADLNHKAAKSLLKQIEETSGSE